MRKYQGILGGIILLHIVIMLLTGIFFKEDSASLAGREIADFNKGWTITGENGTVPIEELPYRGDSAAGETVVLECQIPEKYMGQTLFFASAEKNLLIRVDGTEIYSYGGGDESRIVRSPGGAYHFVDLPDEGEGYLEIEMYSVYQDAASCVERMRLAEHDAALAKVLREKLPVMACSLILMMEGIIIAVLVGMRKLSGRPAGGMAYLGSLLFFASLAYSVETGMPSILAGGRWSGGQAACVYLVYAYMMCAPVLLLLYYMRSRHCEEKMECRILLGAGAVNMALQLVLQFFRAADFYRMAWISLLLNVVCAGFILYQIRRAQMLPAALEGRPAFRDTSAESAHGQETGNRLRLEMTALVFLAAGSAADIFMILIRKSADLAVFDRWSVTVYGLLMVWIYLHKIVEDSQEEESDKKRILEREVERKTGELREIQEQTEKMLSETIEALSSAVDAKDRYTSGHSRRVAEYARTLAERMGMDESAKKQIYMAGLLHDVGKIRIPDEIINKAGKLTEEEFNYIKLHTIAGNHILKEISSIEEISAGAKYHHERYDGKGYPNGLEGENIPQIARIIGVADAYDAMASNRSYRKALPQYLVREEIVKGRGTQFDPVIAGHMIALIDEDKEYQMKQTDSLQRTILVVDDEPVNIKIVEYILKDEPMYSILYSYEGHEALKILEEERIDLLLLDIEMPDMNGFEVMEEVRKRKINVAAAFMSADKDFETIERANALGVSDYLTKPFLPIELKEVVRSLIEG